MYVSIYYAAKVQKSQETIKSKLIYFANNPKITCILRQFHVSLHQNFKNNAESASRKCKKIV